MKISNCPAFIDFDEQSLFESLCSKYGGMCEEHKDCPLKQIVDECKAEKDKGFVMSRYGFKVPVSQGYDLACRILKELEIEECE